MLKTRREYLSARSAIEQLERQIPVERNRWLERGFAEDEADRMVEPMELRLAELHDEIRLHERIRAGDLSMFTDFDDYGKALIAARIAQGVTQRELAERLGVHESQVSRDERNEYHGIGTERLSQLFAALGLEFRGFFQLANAPEDPVVPLRPKLRAEEPFVFRRAAMMTLDPADLEVG